MKRITGILILGLIASTFLLPPAYGSDKEGVTKVKLSVKGMFSSKSITKVKEALQAVEGVISVRVEKKEDANKDSPGALRKKGRLLLFLPVSVLSGTQKFAPIVLRSCPKRHCT